MLAIRSSSFTLKKTSVSRGTLARSCASSLRPSRAETCFAQPVRVLSTSHRADARRDTKDYEHPSA